MQELVIGSAMASGLIMIILRVIYSSFDLANKWKKLIAMLLGVGLGIVALFYNLEPAQSPTFRMWVDFIVQGLMTGAASIGFYQITEKKKKNNH